MRCWPRGSAPNYLGVHLRPDRANPFGRSRSDPLSSQLCSLSHSDARLNRCSICNSDRLANLYDSLLEGGGFELTVPVWRNSPRAHHAASRTRRQQLGEKPAVCPRSGGSDQGVTLDEFPNQYRAELNVRILLPAVESRANSGSEMGSASTAPCGCCDARQGSMWVAVGHKRVSPIYNLVARGDAAARSIKRGSPPAGTLCDPPVGAHCFKSRALAKPVAGPVPSRPSFVTTVGED